MSENTLPPFVEEASKNVPLDQLCLSPQCGFSSTEEGNKLTEDDQKELALVVETAAEVSRQPNAPSRARSSPRRAHAISMVARATRPS
jgi:hypothetical protein